jgi:hypothetical protein
VPLGHAAAHGVEQPLGGDAFSPVDVHRTLAQVLHRQPPFDGDQPDDLVVRAFVGDGPAEVDGEERLGDAILVDVTVGRATFAPVG